MTGTDPSSGGDDEARFRAIFESIDEGFCVCEIVVDGAGHPVDYRFLEVNPQFEAMTGLEDPTGRTALELVPDLEPSWIETYGRVALDGEPLRFQQGSEVMGRWFDVYAMPVRPRGCFALVFKDVSAREVEELARVARAAGQERARRRAEMLADLAHDLDSATSTAERLHRLVHRLVPEVGDVAAVEAPGTWVCSADVRDLPPAGLAVPLYLGAEERGVLRVGITDPGRPAHGPEDVEFLARVSERAGAAIVRGRLRDDEHEAVVRLQRALLPARVVDHPRLDVASCYIAAGGLLAVGGDWYDAIELPDGRIALFVGDVVGHGIEAAAAMGRLRAAARALALRPSRPDVLLGDIDELNAREADPVFATACCVFLDVATGALEYASAGHLPPLVVTREGGTAWLDEALGPPVYGTRRPDRPVATATLPAGATLVLFSDGLVERRGVLLDVGLDALREAAPTSPTATAADLRDTLMKAMDVDDAPQDDVVLLCATRR